MNWNNAVMTQIQNFNIKLCYNGQNIIGVQGQAKDDSCSKVLPSHPIIAADNIKC
jgi:hypothetical protein